MQLKGFLSISEFPIFENFWRSMKTVMRRSGANPINIFTPRGFRFVIAKNEKSVAISIVSEFQDN